MPTGIANSGHEVGVFGEVRKFLQQKKFSRVREFGNE
jgi:hypothetical protein